MKTIFILSFILLLLSFNSHAQQTIDKLNANQLKLPKESTNRALILDGAGQVKSSSTITDTELGYLEGLSDTLVNLLSGKANDADVVKLSGNQSVDGIKTFEGKLVASSTVNGSIPCPVMTEVQRDAFTPVEGDCVYNSDTLKLNVFDGSVWKDVGGAGGISLWLTANPYNVNDIIIESDKIYRCLIAHTSSLFSAELALNYWVEVSSGLQSPVSLTDGGTGTAIVPTPGSIVYVDSDSFEQVLGSQGQFLQSNGANPPTFVTPFISAKASNGIPVGLEEIQVPNNLLTETGLNKHLNETGNKNILSNPSFEGYTFSNSWVNSGGTFTQEDFIVIDGLKAAKLVLSSETMSLTQSSTLYQAQFADGVQGLASVRVKSDVDLKVCSIQAGVVSTTNCVDVQANNKWGLYKVPMILGATSNGISIASSGVVSGTVYIDDAFVGAASLTQEMNACNDVSCETEFSAKISSAGVVSAENLDWISSCTSSSPYTCTFNSSVFSVTPNCTIEVQGSTAFGSRINSQSSSNIVYATLNTNDGTLSSQNVNIVCQKQGSDFTAAKQLSNGNTYSSTNADTDWASCGHTTSSFTGLGTVTNIKTQCKRQGGDLLMKGSFTVGTVTAVEARLSLPTWNGVQLTSAGTSVIPSLQLSGDMIYSASSTVNFRHATLIEPSVSYMTFAYQSSTNAAFQKILGTVMSANNQNFSFSSRIPIEGWQQSNIIIGQFNGLESCTDTLECTDTFSAKVSAAGVVSGENVDWINGSGSVVSNRVSLTFNSGIFTVAPNCVATGLTVDNNTQGISYDSLTSSGIRISQSRADAYTAAEFTLTCQKQGVDYVGKTAKAVASDQNIATPGATKSTFCSAKISSTGVISNDKGACISSCTNANPMVCTFSSNYWASEPNCKASSETDNATWCKVISTSSSSTSLRCFNDTGANTFVTSVGKSIMCHGERQ